MKKLARDKIQFEPWFLRESAKLAVAYLSEKKGIKPPRDFDVSKVRGALPSDPYPRPENPLQKYLNEFNRVLYRLCEEAYVHSYTPAGEEGMSGGLSANPRIKQETKNKVSFFYGSDGFFARHKGSEQAQATFDSATTMLTNVYLETVFGIRSKDTAYKSASQIADEIKKQPTESEVKLYNLQVEQKRYVKDFFVMVMLHVLKIAFQLSPDEIKKYLSLRGVMEEGEDAQLSLLKEMRDPAYYLNRLVSTKDARPEVMSELNQILDDLLASSNLGEILAEKLEEKLESESVVRSRDKLPAKKTLKISGKKE